MIDVTCPYCLRSDVRCASKEMRCNRCGAVARMAVQRKAGFAWGDQWIGGQRAEVGSMGWLWASGGQTVKPGRRGE